MAFKSTMDGKAIRAILKKFPFVVISMNTEVNGIVYGTQIKLSRSEFAKNSLGGHELDLRRNINRLIRNKTGLKKPLQTNRQFIYGGMNYAN